MRNVGRVSDCTLADARTRLEQARGFADVARLVLDEEVSAAAELVDVEIDADTPLAGIAAALAVLSGIVRYAARQEGPGALRPQIDPPT